MRARDLGIPIGSGHPGATNAITDVPGVLVGHATLAHGQSIRTGVTVVLPGGSDGELWRPVFAGCHTLNGNGELTGLEWIRDSGLLASPVGLTNSFSVGAVRDALVRVVRESGPNPPDWLMPVVGETFDGVLNDIEAMLVGEQHVREAVAAASSVVQEGCCGAGTGTICHGFKGGIGTSSRRVSLGEHAFTLGVLVQANHGRRERLVVNGVPVGRRIAPEHVPVPSRREGAGSIIVVVATDAPLLPHQCTALARRATLGIARTGGTGESDSGDLVLAFSTGNRVRTEAEERSGQPVASISALAGSRIDPLYDAVIEATEESIVNCLVAASTVTGRGGVTAHAIDHDELRSLLT